MPSRDERPSERSAFHEWDPLAPDVLDDQRGAYDDLRSTCPVAHSDLLGWSVLRHAAVLDVIHDRETYCNHVSQYLSVPNGMDPPEHTPYRRLIEPYFGPEPMARFEPVCDIIATELVTSIPRGCPIEVMDTFGHEFAVRVQCAFMGWSHDSTNHCVPGCTSSISNLLYGAGIHVCPGAPLARLELRSFVTAFLAATERLRPELDPAPVRATYPVGGYRSVWVVLDDPA